MDLPEAHGWPHESSGGALCPARGTKRRSARGPRCSCLVSLVCFPSNIFRIGARRMPLVRPHERVGTDLPPSASIRKEGPANELLSPHATARDLIDSARAGGRLYGEYPCTESVSFRGSLRGATPEPGDPHPRAVPGANRHLSRLTTKVPPHRGRSGCLPAARVHRARISLDHEHERCRLCRD